jgi:hypothetical protein
VRVPAVTSESSKVQRWRRIILVGAAIALALKLLVAATTYGTNDIGHWYQFMALVHQDGPVAIYKFPFQQYLYNHPPLIGYFLQFVNYAKYHWGIQGDFTIRAVASLSDVATTVLVFEMLRARGSLRNATIGAAVIVLSPVLFIVSGYHGNTDTIFTMLALLSLYLLADRDRPMLAGAAMALSLGVKIVPVVAVPCLVVFAYRRGVPTLLRFLSTFVVVSAVYWLPALLREYRGVKDNVLGYAGLNPHEWGLGQFERSLGNSGLQAAIDGPGRLVIVALCAVAPAALVWFHPERIMQSVAFSLAGFLLLTPTFGTQYLSWAAAATVLLSLRGGVAYNLFAGILLFKVYTRWNGGLPWDRTIHASAFTPGEREFAALVWVVLLVVLADGVLRLRTAPGRESRTSADDRSQWAFSRLT